MKIISNCERAARFGRLDWRFVDLTGKTFGRLHVLGADGTDVSGHHRWHCVCDCGASKIVNGTSLRLRRTISCGCFMRERHRERPMIYSRARRITRLGVKRARALTTAIHGAIGPRALDKVLEISSRNSHKLPASAITRKKEGQAR